MKPFKSIVLSVILIAARGACGPDEQNQIHLKAYGVAEKDKPCGLMALATPTHASLNLGSLLNGDQIGAIDI